MNLTPQQQILWDMEVLYKTTVELYESYFKMLEAAIEKTPDTDTERLTMLHELAEEAEQGLQADMGVFEKTLSMDSEAIANMQDELKIHEIYKKLQK